jgi:hypothetical protein
MEVLRLRMVTPFVNLNSVSTAGIPPLEQYGGCVRPFAAVGLNRYQGKTRIFGRRLIRHQTELYREMHQSRSGA